MTTPLLDKATGCLLGAAVGDALGGATEGWSPDQIRERWGGWVTGIVPPYYEDWRHGRPISPYHKGDGHVTDDTLMTGLLVEVYAELGRHLSAFDVAGSLVPKMIGEPRWIPELETEAVPLQRLFLAEKYPAFRLHWAHVDPREAGVGNAVNCGAAMYVAPVGIVNAADPDRAYAEAVDLAGAHQHSFGREAAGVMAAAVAAAMAPDAAVDDVVDTCLRLAQDGTRTAIAAVVDAAKGCPDWQTAIETGALRDAVRPFDTVADTYREPGLGARRASRLHSIEELPIALGFLVIGGGAWERSVIGAVNYGRDADSIATMAGAIVGALHGAGAVPAEVAATVQEASRLDLDSRAQALVEATTRIRRDDQQRQVAVDQDYDRLVAS